jgi:hypothetical protein
VPDDGHQNKQKEEAMNATETRTIWDIYESPRKGAEETTALFEWSRNYNYPTPATVFLGLIGWEDMEIVQGVALGYMELDYLGDALKEYACNPYGVTEAIAEMLEKEGEE